ncbi:hypothetical protein [Streptomyces alanosinicus]|nr:hypothetical protein [Streptomyces alanosinicus]
MLIRPLAVVLLGAVVISGCSSAPETSGHGGKESPAVTKSPTPPTGSDTTDVWGKGDYEQAMKRLARAVHDPDAELVDEGYPDIMEGLRRTFRTPGKRPYRLDVSCDSPEAGELTLRLRRGKEAQDWTVPCNDHEADRFNIPATDTPFTATIDSPDSRTTGLIHWRLNTIGKDQVEEEECVDDIRGCDK